jgi:hypothetical protein
MVLLLFMLDVRGSAINSYTCFVGNKQFKRFIAKVFTNFILVKENDAKAAGLLYSSQPLPAVKIPNDRRKDI